VNFDYVVIRWYLEMKAKEFRDLSNTELEAKVQEFKEELFNLRFQQVTKQLENPKRISALKKDIARAKTILAQRAMEELAEAVEGE